MKTSVRPDRIIEYFDYARVVFVLLIYLFVNYERGFWVDDFVSLILEVHDRDRIFCSVEVSSSSSLPLSDDLVESIVLTR